MSSAEPRTDRTSSPGAIWGRRSVLRALSTTVFASLALAACGDSGFRPLYGSGAFGGGDVNEKLARLEIAPIPGRVGQRIRNELIFQSTGGGKPQLPPEYRLEIAIRETVTSTLLQTDGEAKGAVYNLDASFRLIRIADKSVALTGTSYGRAGYDRNKSIFSNVRAREDAENRAATTVGEELKTRLAAYLSSAA
jgi:LPS-assembly lipoprotein